MLDLFFILHFTSLGAGGCVRTQRTPSPAHGPAHTVGGWVALVRGQVGPQDGVVVGVEVDGQRVIALGVVPHLHQSVTLSTSHSTYV